MFIAWLAQSELSLGSGMLCWCVNFLGIFFLDLLVLFVFDLLLHPKPNCSLFTPLLLLSYIVARSGHCDTSPEPIWKVADKLCDGGEGNAEEDIKPNLDPSLGWKRAAVRSTVTS